MSVRVSEIRDSGSCYLDDKIHVSLVIVRADRRVWLDDQVSIDLGGQVDVLTDGQTKDVLHGRQSKPEPTRVMADFLGNKKRTNE